MSEQAKLFGVKPSTPAKRRAETPPAAPLPFGRGPSWRAPTAGEHVCDFPGCGSATGFGVGAGWRCRDHLPAGYFAAKAAAP